MGRGKRRQFNKGGRGGGRGGGGGGAPRSQSWTAYADVEKKHEKLEKYYNTLLQLPEEEKEQFWEALRRELPNSFRFAGSKGHAISVRNMLKDRYMPEIVKIEHADGRTVEPPQPVPWYPNELAWSMTTPKNIVRKFAPFSAFQKFLVSETSIGNISRQEVVSMIPPLVMDVQPGHVVLDMCASPGSKATQLLEMIHRGEEARIRKVIRSHAQEDGLDMGPETEDERDADLAADPSDDGRATGLLIANDADYKRCHMLVHQLKRLSSPNMIVTNHDATMFPSIRLPSDAETPDKPKYMKFDRILADVPCSGDGTMRKNANLWNDWNPNSALGLHNTQIKILVRALTLLKPGGRVVYSTCSMNPVENEAVVGAAIERCGGSDRVEIVDCANELPALKRKSGMKTWSVIDRSGRIYNSMEEYKEQNVGKDSNAPGKLVETMFPLPEGSDNADLPLERCMRVYAHLQDTGGFFITVLHKKKEIKIGADKPVEKPVTKPAETAVKTEPTEVAAKTESTEVAVKVETETKPAEAAETAAPEAPVEVKAEGETQAMDVDASTTNGTKRPREDEAAADEEQDSKKVKVEATPQAQAPVNKQPRNKHGLVEEPFKYLPSTHQVLEDIRRFYTLSRFPTDRFMIRNASGDPAKAIYYTSQLVKDVLVENEGRSVKFVHGGVKMFMKQDVPAPEVCRWRIQSEGMPIVEGYVGEQRVVRLQKKETLRKLLIQMFIKINDGAWESLGEIGERVRDMGMGCAVMRVEPDGTPEGFEERMAIPLWKSFHSLNLMLPKEDRSAMLLRIFNDTTPLVNNALTKEKQAKVDAEKAAKENGEQGEEAAGGENGAAAEESKEETLQTDDLDAIEDAPSP